MKATLVQEDRWVFYIEPEDEVERCALAYLQTRPKNNFEGVRIGQWILFVPEEKEEN